LVSRHLRRSAEARRPHTDRPRVLARLLVCAPHGLGPAQDTSIITIILDVASYFTAFVTNFVTSAIQQDQLNRLVEKLERRLTSGVEVPA